MFFMTLAFMSAARASTSEDYERCVFLSLSQSDMDAVSVFFALTNSYYLSDIFGTDLVDQAISNVSPSVVELINDITTRRCLNEAKASFSDNGVMFLADTHPQLIAAAGMNMMSGEYGTKTLELIGVILDKTKSSNDAFAAAAKKTKNPEIKKETLMFCLVSHFEPSALPDLARLVAINNARYPKSPLANGITDAQVIKTYERAFTHVDKALADHCQNEASDLIASEGAGGYLHAILLATILPGNKVLKQGSKGPEIAFVDLYRQMDTEKVKRLIIEPGQQKGAK